MRVFAVDPGKAGGFALGTGGLVKLYSYRTETEYLDLLTTIDPSDTVAVVEEVPPFAGMAIPSHTSFKLGYNYGFEVGALRALGFQVNLVKPKVWQKGLSGLNGLKGAPRKRALKDHAVRLYPHLVKKSGKTEVTLATADALLILHWWGNRNAKA